MSLFEPLPEEALHSSAPKIESPGGIVSMMIRARPGSSPRQSKERSREAGNSANSKMLAGVHGKLKRGMDRLIFGLGDWVVGLREKKFRLRHDTSSPRAWEEWSGYYRDAHDRSADDLARFKRLLYRNGLPDQPNPYQPYSEEYFMFHPMGLIFADLEVLLSSLISAAGGEGEKKRGDEGVCAALSEWPTMEEWEREEDRLFLAARTGSYEAALLG